MDDKADAGNVTAESAAENTTAPAKKATKSTKAKAKRVKATHPPTSEMVTTAIKELKDRKGSSLQAIKKYIVSTYKVDGDKCAPFIKKYLKAAVTSGSVLQTKGKGASGSFKLATEKSDNKVKKVQRSAKKVQPKKSQSVEKKSVAKKSVTPKKAAVSKKASEKKASPKKVTPKAAAAKSKAPTEAKSMSKAKKAVKAPAAKTRTPKPKKATTPRAVKSPAKK